MMRKLLINLFAVSGFASVTAGFYLKFGLADALIVSGAVLVIISILAAIKGAK